MNINELHQSSPNLNLLTEITSSIEAACCFMLITTTGNLAQRLLYDESVECLCEFFKFIVIKVILPI